MITFAYSDNSDAVSKALEAFQDALAENSPALQQVADDFREMVQEQFATEGRAEGTPWAARRGGSQTRPYKAPRHTRGLPLLVRTGALRDSLTRKGAAGSVEEQNGQSLTLGSRLPDAIFHQLGTRRMTARTLVVLNDARTAKWTDFVRNSIEKNLLLLGKAQLS